MVFAVFLEASLFPSSHLPLASFTHLTCPVLLSNSSANEWRRRPQRTASPLVSFFLLLSFLPFVWRALTSLSSSPAWPFSSFAARERASLSLTCLRPHSRCKGKKVRFTRKRGAARAKTLKLKLEPRRIHSSRDEKRERK